MHLKKSEYISMTRNFKSKHTGIHESLYGCNLTQLNKINFN